MKYSVHVPSLKSAFVVAIATLLSGLTAYLLSIASARVLSPSDFGAFNTILSLCLVGNSLALAIQVHVAREIVDCKSEGLNLEQVRKNLRVLVFQVAAVTAAIVILSSPLLARIFRIDFWTLVFGLLSLVPVILGFANIGLSQGSENHSQLASNIVLNVGGRAVVGTIILIEFGTLFSASFGILLGSLFGALLSSHFTKFYPLLNKQTSKDWNLFWKSWVALGALFFLINVDVLVARYLLSPDESGAYSAGSVLSRVAFFIPGAVLIVLFPRFNSKTKRNYLKITFALTLAIGLAVSLSTYLFRDLVISVLGGLKYVSIKDLLWLFCVQGSIFALIQISIYQMTNLRDRMGVFMVLSAGLATVFLGNASGGTLSGLIVLSIIISSITCAFAALRIGIYKVKFSKDAK